MKDLIKFFLGFVAIIALVLLINSNSAQATDCKWKYIDCPGWGTGGYEACLVTGDGNTCTCGEVTRDCPGQD